MIRAILLALVLTFASLPASAQLGDPATARRWSVGTGLGFAADIGTGSFTTSEFNWQIDGQYRLTDPLSVGAYLQVIPTDGGTIVNFAADSRYHFDVLRRGSNEDVRNLTPYLGLGMGLAHAGVDVGNLSDNAFLIAFIAGLEYDLSEHVALTSDMRFNVLAGELFGDGFMYTWQVVGARLRF